MLNGKVKIQLINHSQTINLQTNYQLIEHEGAHFNILAGGTLLKKIKYYAKISIPNVFHLPRHDFGIGYYYYYYYYLLDVTVHYSVVFIWESYNNLFLFEGKTIQLENLDSFLNSCSYSKKKKTTLE